MKKRLILASGLLAVLGASCTQDETLEVNTQPGITFRAFTENMTRATSIEAVGADGLNSFDVWGFGNSGRERYDFTNTFNLQKDGKTWAAADGAIYHWPGDDTQMKFFAYNGDDFPDSGDNGDIAATFQRTGAGKTQFTANLTVKPARDAEKQRDLVVAYAEGTNKDNATTGVTLNFRHALSKIVIKAMNGATDEYKVEVIGAYLGRYNSQGRFDMPQASTSTQNTPLAVSQWKQVSTPTTSTTHYKVKNTAAVTLNGTAQTITGTDKVENSFMIIPQNTTAWDSQKAASGTVNSGTYISVMCRIYQKKAGVQTPTQDSDWNLIFPRTNYGSVGDKYGLAAVGVGGQIEPGKSYTYTLQFFKDGGGAGVTDPDPDTTDPEVNPEDPNKPIVGGALKFNVTVDKWQTGATTDTPMGPTQP